MRAAESSRPFVPFPAVSLPSTACILTARSRIPLTAPARVIRAIPIPSPVPGSIPRLARGRRRDNMSPRARTARLAICEASVVRCCRLTRVQARLRLRDGRGRCGRGRGGLGGYRSCSGSGGLGDGGGLRYGGGFGDGGCLGDGRQDAFGCCLDVGLRSAAAGNIEVRRRSGERICGKDFCPASPSGFGEGVRGRHDDRWELTAVTVATWLSVMVATCVWICVST